MEMKSYFEGSFAKLLYRQIGEYRFFYLAGLSCLIITHIIQSKLPLWAKELADNIYRHQNFSNPLLFLFLAFGIIIFRTGSRVMFFYPARLLQKKLREELIFKLEHTPPLRFQKYSSGEIYQYINGDIEQIRALIGFVGLQLTNFIIAMFVIIPKIIAFNIHLLWALIPLVLALIIFTVTLNLNKHYFKKSQEAQASVSNFLIESYEGKKTIANFLAEKSFLNLFNKLSSFELYQFYRSSLPMNFTMPLFPLGVGGSLLAGAYIIMKYHLSATSLIWFSGFIFLLLEPMSYMSWVSMVYARSKVSFLRAAEFYRQLEQITEVELDFKNKNDFLGPDHLEIPFWQMSAIQVKIKMHAINLIVAKTGDGKSELLYRIAEIYKLKGMTVSMVLQDPYLFNDTIYNNIFLYRNPSAQDLILANELLSIMEFDFVEKDRELLWQIEVGENGKRLSGGQIKRLALIRSLMVSADVYLWDDPFSAIDMSLEKIIMKRFNDWSVLKNKTIITTTHRLSSARNSQYIIYLDRENGILEEGPTHELFNHPSRVYEFFQKQMV